MFKISTIDTPSKRRLLVEGMLTEPWATELRTSWKNAANELGGRKLVIDLSNVTVIGRDGESAISDLLNEGAKFSCEGIFTRHVLTRLSRICPRRWQRIRENRDE